MEVHTETAPGVWTTPQCPFTIEYTPRALDDIRLAVMDAFFSLPRGGAEIGGVLLGSHANGRVIIADQEALECEHAFGPGFTLSDNDKARLVHLLMVPRSPELQIVGWYHSHTRSEIFLSEADLEIHREFFGQPWHVALVMKPHTFQPPRVGFFFRGADGSIHASESYHEFQLEPLAVRQVPAGAPPLEVARSTELPPPPTFSTKVITLAAEPVPAEPVPVEPIAAQPAAARPVVAEPVVSESIAAELVAPQPVIEPAPDEPVIAEAIADEPVPDEPVTAEPIAAEPVSDEPAIVEAIADEPVPDEPVIAEPIAAEPVAAAPAPALEPIPEPPTIESEETPEPEPYRAAPVPQFLQAAPSRSFASRRPVKIVIAMAACAAIVSAAAFTRQAWLPPVLAGFSHFRTASAAAPAPPAHPVAPPTIALSVLDADGQLQIHWDQNSPTVRGASQASLEIVDSGSAAQTIPLDALHLGSGSFTYARQGERVDVALAVNQPGGKLLRETTTFVGKVPVKPEDTAELHKRIDDLGRQNLQLQSDLKTAAERAKKLERSLADSQAQLHKQQRSRLENQLAK